MISFALLAIVFYLAVSNCHKTLANKRYSADWRDLKTRPLPEWFDRAKIGIFIHWGVYSVPSFGSESEWFWFRWKAKGNNENYTKFMKNNYPPGFSYQQFAPMFTAEYFDPDAWAELFAKSGANYIVLTSKHHDGFALFPSERSPHWNSVDVGPKRDIVRDLSIAVRKHSLKFGVYYSLKEWHNQLHVDDRRSNFKNTSYTRTKLWPDVMQLVNDYKPSVIWADGDWDARDSYWGSQALLAWLYNDSPVKDEVVVNDRWGRGSSGRRGDFYNYGDRHNPGVLLKHKWENALSIDRLSWGYRRTLNIDEVLSITELLYQLVSTISCGGNILINVGPTKEGTIIPIFQERLLFLGKWLSVNGEAIYDSSPWYSQKDSMDRKVWYTCQKKWKNYNDTNPVAVPDQLQNVIAVYAIILKWPTGNLLRLNNLLPTNQQLESFKVEMLGNAGEYLPWIKIKGIVKVQLPDLSTVKSTYAWTLKFTIL